MFLSEFPGQSSIKDYFKKIVSEQRVPHALLLLGPEGVGKLQLAIGLASLLQCKNPVDSNACRTCKSCIKNDSLVHPDLHFAFPVTKKDNLKREDTVSANFIKSWRTFIKEHPWGNLNDWLTHIDGLDKQANINVAECNMIIKSLGLKSFEGKYKIQIIWMSEFLGKESNRLLKLIEEPSPDTIIILISNNRNAILNTIKSRCQIISVAPLQDEDIRIFLNEKYDLSGTLLDEIIFIASGDIRKAELLATKQELKYSEELLDWLRVSFSGDPEKITGFVEYLTAKGRQELINFFNYGLHFFREYYLGLNTQSTDNLRLSTEEKNTILKMQRIVDENKTIQLEQLLSSCINYVKRNISLKILLMNTSLEINTVLKAEVNNLVS